MHFWIDKRSQTCGFGRARVAASLSGTGLGFGHHPRRIGSKSMVTPVHRFQSADCRPFVHRPTQHHYGHQQPSQHQNQQYHHHQSNSQQSSHHQQQSHNPQHHSHSQSHHNYSHQQQLLNAHPQYHIHQHHASSPRSQHYACNLQNHQTPSGQSQPHLGRRTETCITQHRDPAECNVLHQIGQPSTLELERGNLDMDNLEQVRTNINDQNSVTVNETQLLPSHLKCGMWASLALATVFVAVFQGTGLEILIFGAFSASFFIAACTISICRRPRNVLITPSLASNLSEPMPTAEQQTIQPLNPPESAITIERSVAPPPPYHIAILLPENSKDIQQESPPPSYDKLGI